MNCGRKSSPIDFLFRCALPFRLRAWQGYGYGEGDIASFRKRYPLLFHSVLNCRHSRRTVRRQRAGTAWGMADPVWDPVPNREVPDVYPGKGSPHRVPPRPGGSPHVRGPYSAYPFHIWTAPPVSERRSWARSAHSTEAYFSYRNTLPYIRCSLCSIDSIGCSSIKAAINTDSSYSHLLYHYYM